MDSLNLSIFTTTETPVYFYPNPLAKVLAFGSTAHNCFYCECPLGAENFPRASKDHIHPKSLGGKDYTYNLVWACQQCNSHKSNLPIWDWLYLLQTGHSFAPRLDNPEVRATIIKNVKKIIEAQKDRKKKGRPTKLPQLEAAEKQNKTLKEEIIPPDPSLRIGISGAAQSLLDKLVHDANDKLPADERIFRDSDASTYIYNLFRGEYAFSKNQFKEIFEYLRWNK